MTEDSSAPRNWGGARPGAGRPRTKKPEFDARELRLFHDLLLNSLHAGQHTKTLEKLERLLSK